MEVVRLPFNHYARQQILNLEQRERRTTRLATQFEHEIDSPLRAIYLGVYDGACLAGCARLVAEPLGAVLLDALEVPPEHARRAEIEQALLAAARAIAAAAGKRLCVISHTQVSARWTALGFQPDAQAVLTLGEGAGRTAPGAIG